MAIDKIKEFFVLVVTKEEYNKIISLCKWDMNQFHWLDILSKVTGIDIGEFPITVEVYIKLKD